MRKVQKDLLPYFCETLSRLGIIKSGTKILCALSGGPDSIALCDLLHRASELLSFSLAAAHLNHRLRGKEADADEEFVKEFCHARAIPLTVSRRNVRTLAHKRDISIEMAAREARYNFLRKTAKSLECGVIALGHTSDDRLENLILRLLRGAGGRGLGSLTEVRESEGIIFIRPMLKFTREEIINYLEWRNLSFRIDSTNLQTETDRGRLRNVLLPELIKIASELGWSGTKKALARSAELLAEDQAFLDSLVAEVIDEVEPVRKERLEIDTHSLENLASPLLARVILALMEKLDPTARLEKEHVEAIGNLITGKRKKAVDVPGNFRVKRSGTKVIINKREKQPLLPEPVVISLDDLPAKVSLGSYNLYFKWVSTKKLRTKSLKEKSHKGIVLLSLPNAEKLILRVPKPGDRISPLGMGGHSKKLSDILIDRKAPQEERAFLPVIEDGLTGRILALPAIGLVSEWGKVEISSSKVLEIKVQRRHQT